MKRSKAFVPARESNATGSDGQGQGIGWVNKGGRNATTEESRRGAGQLAPRPQTSGSQYLGSSAHTAPTTAAMARVQDSGSSPTGKMPTAGSFTPVQNNANANLTGQATGQADVLPRGNSARISPVTKTPVTPHPLATVKPKRKSIFFGDLPGS